MPVTFDDAEFALLTPKMAEMSVSPSMRTPVAAQEAAVRLVAELRRAGWDIPGVDVEFQTHRIDGELVRSLSKVSGKLDGQPFKLRFLTPYGSRGTTFLTGAVIPPGIDAEWFSDGSGPSLEVYVGKDWASDGQSFMSRIRVNSRLRGEPKTYLKYRRAGSYMIHDNDLGREYEPEADERRSIPLSELDLRTADFVARLADHVAKLPAAPGHDDIRGDGDANLRRLASRDPVPVPSDFPVLFARVEREDVYRHREHRDPLVKGTGIRLAAFGVKDGKGRLPKRAHDGFTYASTDPARPGEQVVFGVRENSLPVAVRLKALNEIFVVDNAAFEKAREADWKVLESEGKTRATDAHVDSWIGATARTMVPAAEYRGGFEKPVYLIGRELSPEEAALLTGIVELTVGVRGVSVHLADTEGHRHQLFSFSGKGPGAIAMAERVAADAAQMLHARVKTIRLEEDAEPALPTP